MEGDCTNREEKEVEESPELSRMERQIIRQIMRKRMVVFMKGCVA